MKRFILPAVLLLPCLMARADAPSSLTVTPPDMARYDFGTRTCGDSSPLTHTFRLRNGGTQTLTVTSAVTSCHCTEAEPEGNKVLPVTLAPGATLPLVVTVDTNRLGPGPVSKTVWVFVRGALEPAATLEVTGTLRPAK